MKAFLWLVFLLYMGILTKLIIFKKPIGYVKNFLLHRYSWSHAKANFHKANLTPFATIKLYLNSHLRAEYAISNLLGNFIGFIPLGILLPLLFSRLNFISTVLCVFLCSLSFETVQLFSMLGAFDVDDLLLNTLGGMFGYILLRLLIKRPTIQTV